MARHPGSLWINENYDKLPKGEYVAASANGMVAHDPDYDELIKKIEDQNIPLSDVVIMQIPQGITQG